MADNNILFFNDGQGHIRQVPANQVNIFKKYFPKATPADEEKLSAIESKRAAEAEQREGKKITAPKIRTIDADNIFKAENVSLGESKTLPEVAEETYYTHKQDPEIAFSAKYGAYKENPQLFRDRDKRADETELTDLAKQRYKQETKSKSPLARFTEKDKRKAEMESLQDFLANTPSGREFVEYEKQEKEALEQFGKQLNEEIGKLEKEIKKKATARQKLLDRPVEGTRYGVPLAWLSKEEKEKISAQKAKDAQEADKIATADDIERAHKNLQELKNLQAAVKDKDRNFISQFFREAGRRLPESLYNIGTMGLADLTEGLSPKQGGELTRQSEELLGQYASLHQADRTIAQDIARGTTESLEFMAQFAGTGGIVGGVSKGIGKTILKEGTKKAATKGAKKVIKIAGKEIAESLLQTAIMPSTIAMSIEKNAQEPGSFLDAFSKSYLSNLVEVMSERVGEFIPGLKIKGLPQSIQKLQKVTGIQGWFAELGEEQFATIGHAILGDGQGEWSDLIDPRQQLITAGVVGVMQIPYVSITTGGYAAAKFNNAKQKRSINKAYVKNVENMKNVFGDEAEHVQKWINGVVEQANSSEDNTAMIPALILSVAQSEEFDEKQADAITKYTLSYLAKSGMEKGKAEQIQEAQQEAQEIAQEAINPETKSVILAKVPGMTEPTLIEGDIVLHEDGTIDAHKSGEIFYTDTDGNRKVIDPKFVEIVENVPADQAIEELTAAKTAEVINRQANDEVRPYEIGEVVRFSPDGNVSLIGKIQEIDEEGNYQVVVEGVPTPVSIEPRMIIEEENLRGVDNGVTVDYRDENGNIVTGTVDDASIRNHGVIVIDGKEVRNEDVIGVHQEGVTQPQEADKMTQEAPESESVSPDKIQQNVRETAETVAESQITPEQQAEAEKQQFMQSLPIVEKGKNKGRIDQSRMTPEQNIKYFEYQYGKEKAVEAARKMADNLKARIKKEQAKLDADPFNIAQNELVDSLTKQQKAYQDYAFEAMQEKTEKNIEELPKSSVLEERKKRKEEIQEEEASKTGTVSQSIKEKWDAAEKIEGIEDVITLANGEKIPGRYVLTTADAPSPSHDVDRNFAKTKGFPVNEQGKTVNDRDYEADEHAQLLVQQRANKYDERAVQTPVVVSKDGIVLSGNDRTMAGKIAARNGTDKAYVDYITKYADRWGFTPQMIKSFDYPRIVFVPDVELPYNTATFAKFNAEEKKTQSSLESAIKASKSLSKDVIIPLANIIDEFEKLNDFYANKQATKTAIQMLLHNNVIQPNEVPRLMDGELLSTEGKSFLETVMLASVLKEQALREIDTMRSVRQSLMRIMPQLISNAALRDYTLTSELNNAIHLLYEAKQTGSKVKLQLMQGSIFDAPASQIYKETEKLLAIMLENTKDTEIRAIFESYNKEASAVESGQIDMFEGILSKPNLLSLILNKYGQQTESTRQDEPAAKGDGKGEGDRSGRGESEREGQQPGEQSTGKGTKQQEIKEPNDYIRRTVDKWVDLYEKGEYEEIFDDDIFNNVYANKHIIKPFEERIGITIPDISAEKAKKDFIKSLKEKFVKPETDSLKRNQYEIIRQSNPIRDDIHTGIRSESDILTAEEAFTPSINENEDVTPDFTVSDMKEALKSGRITVYSSYPIENGVFVTPSKMEAQNYAGKNKVYSKTVPLSNVAWIDAIEGQYTEIEHEKEEKQSDKNKRDEQREGSKEAFELETEAIESASKAVEYKSKNVGSDKQSAGEVKEESDELIEQVEEQLQKIDLRLQDLQMTGRIYLTGGIYADNPINVLAKGVIKKDATKFVDAVKKLTGLQYDTNKKGKTEKVSVNIAPAGGDISFFLWSNVDPELGVYVSIPVEGSVEYDEYSVPKEGNILWKLTTKKNKYTGLENQWVKADITAGELSKIILNELNRKLAEEGKPEEKPEDVTSDKVNEKTKITSPEKKKAGDSGQKQLLDIKPGKPEPQPFDIVQKAKEVVKKDQERRSPEKKKKTLSDYPLANKFITDWQKPAVRDMWESHESIVENIEKTLESMPRKPQDNGMKSTVYAHYFMGATDIFVMDVEGDNIYAYVILNGDSQMSEAGTMSLSYITGIMGMELDFFWTPKPLDEALYNADREYFPNPKEVKKEISGEKTTEIKEKPLSLTENKSEVEPEKEKQNERERTEEQDGRRDNSRAESGREILPESKQVGGQGTPATDTTGHSQSRRGDIDVSGSQPGAGFKYDLSKSYSNEEIHQIVSSVTDIVDGKVVITGGVTDDIKTIAERYIPGGIAKQGRGVLDEYYTDTKIVDTVRDILSKYFNQNKSIRVLEPSVGVGNFIQAVPTNESEIVAFEINETTARIAKIFHPDIEVNARSFETEFIDESGKKKPMPEKYDLVIGNPPYGEHRGIYKGLGEERNIAKYEDYFVKRSLDVLKENGMLAMVLPSGWMNRHKKEDGYRIEVAYRLPEGAFEATKIGTDIVVLKKDSDYHSTEEHNYFGKHPENILGEVKERKNRFGRTEEYVEGDIDTAIEQIKANEAKRIAEELNIEPTTDNIESIENAIDETSNETGAKKVVKATRPKRRRSSEPYKGIDIGIRPDKLKYELNKKDEVVPAALQFKNDFSKEEVEAFKDCDYQGKFKNPEKHKKHANYYKGDWVHDFYYAEGNIYEKLEQLEVDKPNMSAEQYEKQKKMLKDVLPEQKTIDNISISPNTVFVKNLIITTDRAIAGKETLKNLFSQFLSNLPSEAFGDSNVWEVRDYINNNQVYGSDKYRNRLVRERRKKAANDLFHKFIKEELTEAERKQIEYAFNREYNAVYRPDYSKVPMFSSINKNFKGGQLVLTEVQRAGIGRMTVKGVGLLAHEVGFGKTLSGVLAMHEAMTRGFVKKPIVIVPNDSILKQWVETIYESIPNATVNILGNLGVKYDLSDFSINDGEITIVTYSGFKTMGFNDNTYEELASEFEYITDELKSHKSNRDKEKEKAKKAETKGKMKRGASYNFENFGFDYMLFDEVHNANHIVGKVKLDKKEASDFRSQTQRTSDLGIKTWIASQYIQKKNNGRNVCLLSATPFTNKPLEYYSILSLIANSTLKRMGFYRIDQFFETFMEAENDIEIKADGSTVDKTTVRRFKNNGLFNQLLSEFIDIKGEEDNPDLVRPNRHNKEYKVEQNYLTEETLNRIQDLLSDNDTVLSGITQARLAAFSPYASYLCPEKPATHKEFVENSPKIYATVKLIEQNIKDNNEAGQLIYSEIGIEFFPMIRDYLVKESGLKEDEVVIITGATSNKERARIQEAFNKGDVKIIIGSPAIKEGLNLQKNTTDMYILSLPYNFTQLRQVEGRSWRQGNKWRNIRINYMLTNDTVDVFMLQRLQVKQNLYNEAMKKGADSVDVGDINTEELKTALITDPHTRAQIETTIERKRLEDEKTKITADLAFILRKFEKYNELKKDLEYQKESIKKYEEWGKKDEWYRKAADRLKEKLQSYVENLKEEQQKLAEKGVNVDDIENQEKRASEQIKEIDKKIENLKEVQDLLVEKYIKENEEKARKKGETIDKFVSERAKENKTFYEKRKESDSIFLQEDLYSENAETYGSDEKVRLRATNRAVNKYASDNIYFSPIEKALDKIQQEKGTKYQFKAMLLKNGAKQAELDWMGFDELPEKLTKQDIQKWIDANKIDIEEVVKSDFGYTEDDYVQMKEDAGRWEYLIERDYEGKLNSIQEDQINEFEEKYGSLDELYDTIGKIAESNLISGTKYEKWVLPEGKNYKELLLTMKGKEKFIPEGKWLVYEGTANNLYKNFIKGFDTQEDAKKFINENKSKYTRGLDFMTRFGYDEFEKDSDKYFSPHFEEQNILAHVRFDEREHNGEKILFIEEIQSDWAQEGKRKGFSTDTEQGVPDMPFKKTDQWVALVLRRMMRYAAENGFDRIAWTNGEQQAERYDLSKQVDEIKVIRNGDTYTLHPIRNNQQLAEYKNIDEKELDEYVGKDLASKIISDKIKDGETKSYSGLDLKVGGAGMRAFYDMIVPTIANKIAKPFGAKVETIKMDIGEQQSIPVTDKMVDSLINEGIPLFRTLNKRENLKLLSMQNRFDNPLSDTDKYHAAVDMMEIAEKMFKTDVRTVVVKGKREVAQVLRNYGLKEEYADFYDNYEDPIQGVYYKGVVILNSSDINTSGELFDTWIHEIMHDYIEKNKGELIPLLGNVPDEVFEEVLPESYAGLSDLDKLEELLSFLSERVVSSETLPDYDVVKNKIKPIIDKFLNKITDGRYKNNQNIQRERRAVETSYEDIGEGVRQTARTVEERAEAGKSGKDDSAGRYGREGISAEKRIEETDPRLRAVSDVAEKAGSKMPEELRKEYDIKYDRFFTRFREAWEDAFLPVKDFLDLLRKNGVEIADYNDFYKQATHLQGKNDAQLKIFKDSYQHPITIAVNALEKEGFSYRDIENYVFAKHGIERNEYMRNAEIEQFDYNHPDATEEQREAFIDSLPDDYAGLTELVEELGMPAQEYIDSFEKKAGQTAINNLWGAINKATDWILEKQYHTGMINKETYDDLISRYQYYVPLRGHDKETAEDRWDYTPDMGTFFTAPLIRAKGRRSRAESPFAYIEQMAHSAITQGNKNTLKQTILRLAQKENGGLMSATKTWKVNIGTKENPIWVMQSAPYSEDLETYLENQRTFEKRMQELKEEGMAYQGRAKLNIGDLFIKPKQAEQHEIQVYQNGVSHTVYINANPAIAKAINGANRNEVSENMAAILNMTRQMAANFTTRNPLFVMTNLSRDYIYATTMLLAKETPKFALDFQRNIPVAMGALQRYERGKLDLTKQSDRFLYEYMINGGKTGFSHIFELNRVAKALEREAKKGGKKNLADHGRAIIDVIDSFNDVAENMTRLSVYITSRQKGRNITDAINDAKNITVNFNQKGAGSSMAKNGFEKFLFNVLAGKIRPLYLFSNAAIQGLSNIIKVASNHPTRMAAIVSSYALLGFISPMLAMMFGGDDGEDSYMKLTDWERQNNWCILLPNGSFLKIPLPQELRVFHRLGDNIYHAVTGRKDILQTLMDTMFSISDLLPMNPMGAADTSWAELSPDFIRPLAQIATNTNFMGSRIYNEWANKNMPGYLKARTNKKGEYYAPQFMVDWFMMIDHATGGDGVKKGIISLNPDITNHLLRGYFGGLYTLAEQSIGIVKETYNFTKTGEFNVKIRETPLKAFYADKNDLRIQSSGLASRYYKIAEEVAEARRRNKGYLEKVQKGEMGIDEYARKVQELDMQKANLLYEKIRAIKRIEAALKEMTPEEQKQAEEQIGNLMKEVAEMSN